MGTFLTTTGVSYRLEEIIKNANERLILISPFFNVNTRVKELLEDKDRLKIDVRVVYGKSDLPPSEKTWLDSLASVRMSFCENLHAKCYLNENEALLTSMNLYEFSQVNNHEMGMLISKTEEPGLYSSILEESMRLVRISDEKPPATVSGTQTAPQRSEKPNTTKTTNCGFCIRCGSSIPLNVAMPYCSRHYKSWSRYKNKSFAEKQCHACGKKHKSTYSKPECRSCYSKHQAA